MFKDIEIRVANVGRVEPGMISKELPGLGLAYTYGFMAEVKGMTVVGRIRGEEPDAGFHELAVENTKRLHPPVLKKLVGNGAMTEDATDPGMPMEEGELYVFTNKEMRYGAALAFEEGILRRISERFGGDFYILPCSVHETMLIATKLDAMALKAVVMAANGSVVEDEDFLSDNVFLYRADLGKVVVAA